MLGLILEGGGMRAGFVAGALMAFMDRGLTDFDAAVAVSASVPTLAYFAAGQRHEMEMVWRDELSSPKLVCYRNIPAASLALSTRRPLLNLDYLVYDVFKKRYPVDVSAILANKMACRFAVTQVPDGKLLFLSPADGDIYRIFKACIALPGCYPGTVSINGCECVDGGTVHPLPLSEVFDGKVDKVVAILSKPIDCAAEPPSLLERSLFWRYFQEYEWMLEKLWEAAQAYNEQVLFLERLTQENPPHAFIISPDEMPPARLITRDKKKINRTVDLGYQKVQTIEHQLRTFLVEPHDAGDTPVPTGLAPGKLSPSLHA